MKLKIGERIPFQDAWASITANKFRLFPKTREGGLSGFERIQNPEVPDVRHTAKFQLKKSDRFFTIGSCFARNVERALIAEGAEVLNASCKIPGEYYVEGGTVDRNSALNAYNPHSMRDLVRFTEMKGWREIGALHVDSEKDLWADMMLSGLRPLSSAELADVRQRLHDVYGRIREADVLILTLGYTESWFDTVSGVFTNRSPATAKQTAKFGDRFQFFNADCASVIEAIEAIVAEVRVKTRNRAKVVLTVSPVPLSGTYSGADIICANAYSKATLLSAARQVATRHDFVDYFPSYEIVSLAKPAVAWREDGAHVRQEIVDQVIRKFTDSYILDAPEAA